MRMQPRTAAELPSSGWPTTNDRAEAVAAGLFPIASSNMKQDEKGLPPQSGIGSYGMKLRSTLQNEARVARGAGLLRNQTWPLQRGDRQSVGEDTTATANCGLYTCIRASTRIGSSPVA